MPASAIDQSPTFGHCRRMHFRFLGSAWLVGFLTIATPVAAQNLRGDEALSKILPNPDTGWELVADGLGFTDAACSDDAGNFYFCDLGKGSGITKISTSAGSPTLRKWFQKSAG